VQVPGVPLEGSLGGASTVGSEVFTFSKGVAGGEGEIFFVTTLAYKAGGATWLCGFYPLSVRSV
jgi:hypothetical protein